MPEKEKKPERLRILITGGAGYLGGYLTDLLVKHGLEVTVYDNLLYEDRYLKPVPFIYGDVRDRAKLVQIINNFDIIVWLAAIVGDEACAVEPYYTKAINTDSVKWLTENYKGKIIFASTCSVYGASQHVLDESGEMKPQSLYAETKAEAEGLIIKNSNNYLIFRLGTLFGAGDDYSRPRFDLVVNALTVRAAKGETLKVFGGGRWRPLLHIKDAAEAIYFGIKNNLGGIFNVSNKNFMIKNIAEEIQKTLSDLDDVDVKIEYANLKFEDLRNYKVSAEKLRAHGWQPRYDLASGVKEIYHRVQKSRVKELDHPLYYNAIFIKRRFF